MKNKDNSWYTYADFTEDMKKYFMSNPLVSLEEGKSYTIITANPKGIIFCDENGKELGIQLFKTINKNIQKFSVPDRCRSIRLIRW